MKKSIVVLALLSSLLVTSDVSAKSTTYVSVEEARIGKLQKEFPKIGELFSKSVVKFQKALDNTSDKVQLKSEVKKYAKLLWQSATEQLQSSNSFDDRPLYWARLQMAKALRVNETFRELDETVQQELMFKFELFSRGFEQSNFIKKADKKILVTGFDPFFLDRNIAQSNPSGIAAIYLDGKVIELNGQTAEVQSFMIPVRFADFDQGMIETLLSEHFANVDMISTISMGRKDFDLERFPGLRRSANAPGNLNVYTGGNSSKPVKPFLNGKELSTPEFVEFSLPVKAMQKASGPYKVIDNHNVETLKRGKFAAQSLKELANETSVQGSGGGYLSNEISYRSIVLRNKLNPNLPVGHIHTPRIKDWQYEEVKSIVLQIEDMLKQSIPVL